MELPDGVTYRRLHYWISQGYLPAEGLSPGTGHPRELTRTQLRMLTLMGKLRMAGIEAPQAGKIAMQAVEPGTNGQVEVILEPGITILVDLTKLLPDTVP